MSKKYTNKFKLFGFLITIVLYILSQYSIMLAIVLPIVFLYIYQTRIININNELILKDKRYREKKLIDGTSPFHLLLYLVMTFFVWMIVFIESPNFIYVMSVFYVIYTVKYYKILAKHKNITVLESIKQDMPDFSLPDMNVFHIIMFIIISSPFLFFISSIIMGIITD